MNLPHLLKLLFTALPSVGRRRIIISTIRLNLWGALFFIGQPASAQLTNPITVTIKLKKTADTFRVKIASLKYNKNLAFSFTLDDGLVSDYLVAFPYFQGGKVAGKYIDQWGIDQGADGKYYSGLFYTDGCGNSIPFKAAIAINAKNVASTDTIAHPGFLSWKQIDSLYHAGWDILNHGYSHATGKEVNAKYEIGKNNEVVKDHIGMEMRDFVIPGGHNDKLSNGPYAKAAFHLKMETVQCECFGNYLINIDSNLDLSHLKLGRKFLRTSTIEGRLSKSRRLGKSISILLDQDQKFWINAFTHGTGNQNIWNISFIFPEFKSLFKQLALQYGQRGRDNIWFAPTREVYEYLLNSRSVKYTIKGKRKRIKIIIDKNSLPSDISYSELTFVLQSSAQIKKVKCKDCSIESFSKDKRQNLINLKW